MKRALLRTNAPAIILCLRLWLAADFALDAARALGINHYLGVSRIEKHLAPALGGSINADLLHAFGWIEAAGAALIALGLLTRVAILPAALAILAAMASWARVGTLGTATALDATSHALAIAIVAGMLLISGAGPISLDAALTRSRR